MKLKILVKLVEKILGATYHDDQPRADMYLPERLLAMALVMLGGGSACAIWSILSPGPYVIVFAILGICVGIAMLLCWKNQSIHVISDVPVVACFGRLDVRQTNMAYYSPAGYGF